MHPWFLSIALLSLSYLGLLFFIGARMNLRRTSKSIQAVFPSALSGFSTMSSAASLPLTLRAAEDNTGRPEFVRILIPMTVNNHLVGDSLFIPLVGLTLLTISGHSMPTPLEYLPLAFHFMLAKFAVAAVPGGGILVMIPILNRYLGLDSEMQSLITTLYILFDPFITLANIAGNGALAILMSNILSRSKDRTYPVHTVS